MTVAPAGPQLFSMFSGQAVGLYRLRRPAFLFLSRHKASLLA
jgi:hypothetical protein